MTEYLVLCVFQHVHKPIHVEVITVVRQVAFVMQADFRVQQKPYNHRY